MTDRIITSIAVGFIVFAAVMVVIAGILIVQVIPWPPYTVVAIILGVAAAIGVYAVDLYTERRRH